MSQTRYCSTCGTLLSEGAAICGECGARYQASPYERRATDAPGAWSQAPTPRSRDLGREDDAAGEDEGVEIISRDSLEPRNPSATTLRTREQYDQMMVTQPPMPQNAPAPSPGMPSGPGAPTAVPGAPPAQQQLEPPLDGCTPAPLLKRFLAALVDSVIAALVMIPLIVGVILVLTSDASALLPYILIGVGVALPAAYTALMVWLSGAKGFTLGKLILGLRIARVNEGGPIGFVRALGRWFLYGIIPLIMALSIFLDPQKHLRGFHDRVVDSVVVDIKSGRNPMQPRPDDFERASAEHYLGAPSVAVSTHENLLAEPGAAWRDPSAPESAQPVSAGGWGEAPQPAPRPAAPPASGDSGASAAEAPTAGGSWSSPPPQEPAAPQPPAGGGWAPPPVDPVPSQLSWGQPGAEAQPSWAQPGAEAQQPQPSWGQPSAEPQPSWGQPSEQPQQSWGPPAPEQQLGQAPSWEQPVSQPATDAPPQPWAPPPSAPEAPQNTATPGWGQRGTSQSTQNPPSELTGDAWDAEDPGVDEQTRLTVADDPLGDLEQTRISAVQLPPVKKLRLTTDDGAERLVEKAVVVGRNPTAPAEEVLFVMKDDTRSVSKTHLSIDGTGDDVIVTDLGSTNGSTILREDGSRENLVPNAPTVLPTGAQVTLGDRTVSVERMQ